MRDHTTTADPDQQQAGIPLFPSPDHAHHRCRNAALQHAARVCKSHGLRLTRLRRQTLEMIWKSHRPVKAYALLAQLSVQRKLAPPSLYRALHFLEQQGLIHRLRSTRSFIGCSHPATTPHSGQFLICIRCDTVAELPGLPITPGTQRTATSLGFAIDRATVEFLGQCQTCRTLAP